MKLRRCDLMGPVDVECFHGGPGATSPGKIFFPLITHKKSIYFYHFFD